MGLPTNTTSVSAAAVDGFGFEHAFESTLQPYMMILWKNNRLLAEVLWLCGCRRSHCPHRCCRHRFRHPRCRRRHGHRRRRRRHRRLCHCRRHHRRCRSRRRHHLLTKTTIISRSSIVPTRHRIAQNASEALPTPQGIMAMCCLRQLLGTYLALLPQMQSSDHPRTGTAAYARRRARQSRPRFHRLASHPAA